MKKQKVTQLNNQEDKTKLKFFELIDKCHSVYHSCKTIDQKSNAIQYIGLAIKKLRKNNNLSHIDSIELCNQFEDLLDIIKNDNNISN